MKFSIISCSLVSCILFGCTSDLFENNNLNTELPSTSCCKIDEINYHSCYDSYVEVRKFVSSVDSLNEKYPVKPLSRGFLGGAAQGAADVAGQAAGSLCGGWLGASIGALSGNPAVAVVGHMVGKQFGPIVFASAASGLAALFCSASVGDDGPFGEFVEFGHNLNIISDEGGFMDSIGYYHNVVLEEICREHYKYLTNENKVNSNLLSGDVVEICKSKGFDVGILDTPEAKQIISVISGRIASISQSFYHGEITQQQLIEEQLELLKDECNMDDIRYTIYKEYAAPLIFQCAKLDKEDLSHYSNDLSDVIKSSNMGSEYKEFIVGISQVAVNSALCWK